MTRTALLLSIAVITGLTACKTVPEPILEPVVVIAPQPVQTCAPVSALTKVVIPAETKVQYYSTGIDNGAYGEIESARLKRTIIIKPAQIIYVDSNGREILDICNRETIEIGETGPGIGEIIEG